MISIPGESCGSQFKIELPDGTEWSFLDLEANEFQEQKQDKSQAFVKIN